MLEINNFRNWSNIVHETSCLRRYRHFGFSILPKKLLNSLFQQRAGKIRSGNYISTSTAAACYACKKIALLAGGINLPEVAMAPITPMETPTKAVCLTEVVLADELKDDEEYEEILEDMREEGGKFGSLVNVLIPRPNPSGVPSPGIGKVFLEY